MNIHYKQSLIDDLMYDTGHERCGVILGQVLDTTGVRVLRFIELPNRHPEPVDHFRIITEDVKKVMRRSLYTGLGYWHTHGAHHNPEPSERDVQQMRLYPTHVGLVLHPESGTQTWFNARGIININQE